MQVLLAIGASRVVWLITKINWPQVSIYSVVAQPINSDLWLAYDNRPLAMT